MIPSYDFPRVSGMKIAQNIAFIKHMIPKMMRNAESPIIFKIEGKILPRKNKTNQINDTLIAIDISRIWNMNFQYYHKRSNKIIGEDLPPLEKFQWSEWTESECSPHHRTKWWVWNRMAATIRIQAVWAREHSKWRIRRRLKLLKLPNRCKGSTRKEHKIWKLISVLS